MTPWRDRNQPDIRFLFGMTSPAAKAIVVFYSAAAALVAVSSRGGTSEFWPIAIAVLVVTLGAAALIRIPGDPLPTAPTLALTATGPVALGLVLAVLPIPMANPLQLWPLASVTAIYAFLGVRGRPWFAWLGMVSTIATCALWAEVTGQGAAYGLGISVINAAPLLMSTFFVYTLRPAARDIFALREQTTRRAAAEAADSAVLEERDRQLSRLDDKARPLLERIAAGHPLSADERLACRLLEAHLRDSVRAPALSDRSVITAASGARARRVEVTLLDDGAMNAAPVQAREQFLDRVAEVLARADEGAVTVRVLPPGRAAMATVLCSDALGVRRTEFGHDGHPVRAAGRFGDDPTESPVTT